MRIRFLTATPLDFQRGSGTYMGIQVLGRALESLGHEVSYETPRTGLPLFTAERLLFNRQLRPDPRFDMTVGFDMDGYRIAAAAGPYVAALKGVIADELRFEAGLTRLTMGMQARCERQQVHRAPRVLVTSRYSAERVRELYGLAAMPAIVPEPIDLAEWRRLLDRHPGSARQFTVLFVGRHYRRKRVDMLLRAASLLAGSLPSLEVRIVGNGPCTAQWRKLARTLRLEETVRWLGDISRDELAAEYSRADLLCLPSVQEGFGIVLLEAMAAGTAIVAARAGAIPEVVPQATLVDPDSAEALAEGIATLSRSPEARAAQAAAGTVRVAEFDAPRVARAFLVAIGDSQAAAATSPRP